MLSNLCFFHIHRNKQPCTSHTKGSGLNQHLPSTFAPAAPIHTLIGPLIPIRVTYLSSELFVCLEIQRGDDYARSFQVVPFYFGGGTRVPHLGQRVSVSLHSRGRGPTQSN